MNKAIPICVVVVIGLLSLCVLPGMIVSAQTVPPQNADPTVMGPLQVGLDEYNLGDEVFTPNGFVPIELRGVVRYPTNWSGKPLPLIIILHGRNETCFQGTTASMNWPCQPNEQVIPNFKGYDYIAQILASNGYFVVSISANGISANESAGKDQGTQARAELIQKHLYLWNTFNTTGGWPFGTKFVNKIDMQRIGTMGHSRGGEGVVKHFELNQMSSSPYGIKGVFALASTDGNRLKINNVPFAALLPYCDGEVRNLEGVRFYDDSRYNLIGTSNRDTAPKHTILVMGANHNFYNTVWTPMAAPAFTYPGASDDFPEPDTFCGPRGSGRLTDSQQRLTAIAYVCAFMRAYVGGESQFLPLLTNVAPPLASIGANKVHVSFHPPDDPFSRLDVNPWSEINHLSTNLLGGMVTSNDLSPYGLCGASLAARCLNSSLTINKEPHVAITGPGLSQLKVGWNSAVGLGALTNEIPIEHRNISAYQALQFRASVNFDDTLNMTDMPQNFRVVLKDWTGAVASIRASDFSPALFYPPGSSGPVPKIVLNTVRLPLSAFVGVNLSNIRSVEFRFDQPSKGSLLITDIAFASFEHILLPVFSSDICLKDDSTGSELVFNTVTGNYVFCCAGGPTISGVGRTSVRGNVLSLTQGLNERDRRLDVAIDRNTKRGNASLQLFSGAPVCTISDRNIANNTCSCAPAP